MSLTKEWKALLGLAQSTLDNLANLDAITTLTLDGEPPTVVGLRITAGGDVKALVDRRAPPDLLNLQLHGAKVVVELHEARVQLTARIIGAVL